MTQPKTRAVRKSESSKPKPSSEERGKNPKARDAIGTMGFFEHIDELRARLITCLWIFMAGFGGCYLISEKLLEFLRRPLFAVLPPDQHKLYYLGLFENFLVHLKISAVGSVFFLAPLFFYQIWAFLAPGLYPKERKLVIPFVLAGSVFFIGGGAFAYGILFPAAFKFFTTYGGPQDVAMLTIGTYYHTVLKLLLLFGVAFELPVIICFLGYLGVVDAAFLRLHRKNAIIGITVIAALFAPPDAISMIILGVPLVLLYEGSIWVVQALGAKRKVYRGQESSERHPSDPSDPSDQPPESPLSGRSR